jgi:hypothetical protein
MTHALTMHEVVEMVTAGALTLDQAAEISGFHRENSGLSIARINAPHSLPPLTLDRPVTVTQMRTARLSGYTLREIGEVAGLTRQRVHQILQWVDR